MIVPRIAEGCRIPVTNARPSSFFVLNVDARIYSAKVDASPARSVDIASQVSAFAVDACRWDV